MTESSRDHERRVVAGAQFITGFRVAADRWGKGSQVAFSAEYNEYNLERYSTPGLPAVLGWDDDLMYKLDFRFVRPSARKRP